MGGVIMERNNEAHRNNTRLPRIYDSLDEHVQVAIYESDQYFADERRKQVLEEAEKRAEERRILAEKKRIREENELKRRQRKQEIGSILIVAIVIIGILSLVTVLQIFWGTPALLSVFGLPLIGGACLIIYKRWREWEIGCILILAAIIIGFFGLPFILCLFWGIHPILPIGGMIFIGMTCLLISENR